MTKVDFDTTYLFDTLKDVEDDIVTISVLTHIKCESHESQRSRALLGWLKQHPKNQRPAPALTDNHTDNLQSLIWIRDCLKSEHQLDNLGTVIEGLYSPENDSLKLTKAKMTEAGQDPSSIFFTKDQIIKFAFIDLGAALEELYHRLELAS